MLKRKNDRQPPQRLEEERYPNDYWLDEEDGGEDIPEPADSSKPVSGRLHSEPMVTGYEALERQRGVRRPNRKLTRREKKALKRAQKYEAKLHKEHEKADKKNAKKEAKLAAKAEKQAMREAKKSAKKKKSSSATAPPRQQTEGKKVSGGKGSTTEKKVANAAKDKRITAQQSIPYHEMGRDGICRVQDKFYSKTIRFYDINYQLAQNEDKNAIFENWCDFLNYFDTPGAGKSFAAKREITNAFIVTKDDIIVCDPEGEYYPLFRAFHGQVIRISPTSHDYINPMDINLDYADDDDPLSLKSDFILSLCELVVGGKNGLEPVEKTVIDRCVRLVYQDFLSDPVPEKMPILEDLYNLLREQKEQEAQRLATALEIYVNGSLKVFNHRTNVELNNRMVCFDIKDLGKQLKKLGMLIVQDQVWNRVTINRSANKSTRYYIDEFHLLLKEEQTASYSVEIWKRFRKWGGIPTGITQNVKDLLASREIENIFENSDFILMLNQASGDRQILAKQLNISPHQLSYVTNSGEGEGLVFYGSTIIPFKDKFDNSLMLYALMTSKPDEVEKRKKLGIGERDD